MIIRGILVFKPVSPAMNKIMAVVYGEKFSSNKNEIIPFESLGIGQDIVKQLDLKQGDEIVVNIEKKE